MLVAVVSARIVGAPDLLAEIPFVGERQERIHRRAGVGDGEFPVVLPLGRGSARRLDERLRESAQLVHGEVGDVAFLVGQDVVREPSVQRGEPLLDGGVAFFRLSVECRAVAGKAVVGQSDQALLVGAEGRHLLTLVHRLDAGKEGGVLRDL